MNNKVIAEQKLDELERALDKLQISTLRLSNLAFYYSNPKLSPTAKIGKITYKDPKHCYE